MGHVKQGKITLRSSYHYQDLRNKIKNVEIKECNGFLNSEILEKLVSGRFVVDIQNRIEGLDVINKTDDIEPDEDDKSPTWVNFSDVLTGCKETKKFTFNF